MGLPLLFLFFYLLPKATDFKYTFGKEHYTVIDKTASIVTSKGGMRLDAAKNIENIGANLTSKGSITLKAGKDVHIKTLKDKHAYDYRFSNGYAILKSFLSHR